MASCENWEPELILRETQFLVEATSCEWLDIWAKWCRGSNRHIRPVVDEWRQAGGWWVTVGKLDDRPVTVSFGWDWLDRFLVGHWEATSEVVDFKMVNEWLGRHYDRKTHGGREARCNAMNIHFCLNELKHWKDSIP